MQQKTNILVMVDFWRTINGPHDRTLVDTVFHVVEHLLTKQVRSESTYVN